MKRKIIAWLTAAAVVAGMMPGMAMPVFASGGTAVNGSDALAALGIDTSIAPEGFDENDSISNPYGRSTIEVTPVKELYTVGMSTKPLESNDQRTYNTGKKDKIEVGETKNDHDTKYASSNELVSMLYGDEKWGSKTTSAILSDGKSKKLATGSSLFNGKYSVIASGTYEENSTSGDSTGYLSGLNNISSDLGKSFGDFGMSDVAAGNFDGNTKALEAQTVMAYTKDYSHYGGIYLKFGDAKTGNYGKAKEVLPAGESSGKTIGNPSLMITNEEGTSQQAENFAENPYQLKNYLQVATGDWNGDGFDEVAVYVPEKGNSRIVVYALQLLNDDKNSDGTVKESVYTNPAKWGTAWTYYLREGEVVSNMVSLVSADVNQDGIDDLACTWGYYFGPENNVGSKAVVMFGGKGTEILKKNQTFDLTYGTSNIVRGSFLFGDLSGSGEESLILCGQSDADLKAGNINSRYVAAYTWNGSSFQISSTLSKNFDLFSKDDNGDLIYGAMSRNADSTGGLHFYSSPLCVSDTAVITRPIGEDGGDLLYFDSLIIEYTDSGLNISEAWDISKAMQSSTGSPQDYVEYSANAADLTGQKGAAALAVITQTMSSTTEKTATYKQKGTHQEPVFATVSYYKNWWHKIFRKKSYKQVITGYKTVNDATDVAVKYDGFNESHTYMTVVDRSEAGSDGYYTKREEVDSSMALCMANTDNDSSVMNYTGTHYYTYTDPKILAVLASPPYFKDLLDRDDLSGNYAESTTTYSSSKGSGSGTTSSSTISAGAYVSFEQDIKIFGVTVASVEAETQITAGFTWETENTSTLEQTITYSTTAGEDKVAFYSIPMEVYEYQSFVPDGNGGYEEVTTTVNVPHEASVRLLGLDDYEAIASDYSILPQISDAVLTHTVGDPASYPSSITPYRSTKIAMYDQDPAKVGFTSAAGGSAISQEISMSNEKSNAYTGTTSIEAKAGAGAGGVKVGVVAGFEGGGGTVTVSTSGSSFSGELQDMPAEAEAYGYGMNWRIFCYKYADSNMSFPVVSYIVSDVAQPYSLPEDFRQNVAETTEDSVTLEWSYDKMVSGFQIYRYYEFPDGSGSYRLEYVPFSKGTENSDGTYSFSYTDKNLNPYTEYSYQIQTESAFKPKVSIYSEPLVCRTKTTTGYPEITVTGLDKDGNLPVFPDKDNSSAKVNIADADKYKGNISYQWQKLVNNEWTDISGAKTDTYNISRASAADQGNYRCRINVIYFDDTSKKEFQISAYSQEFTAVYSKRVPVSEITAKTAINTTAGGKVQNSLHAQIELHSLDSETAPTGNVVFTITGTDFETSVPVQLKESGTKSFNDVTKHYSTAVLDIPSTSPKVAELAKGAYNISVYYAGDTVFKDLTSDYDDMVLIGSDVTGYQLKLSGEANGSNITKFTYGDDIYASLLAKTGNYSKAQPVTENVKYLLITQQQADDESAELAKAADKQDKSKIFTAKDAKITAGTDGKLDFTAAPDAGVYKLRAYVGDEAVYEASVTIGQKSITVYVDPMDNIKQNEVSKNIPVIKCRDESGKDLPEALVKSFNIGFKAANSAGNETSLVDNMEPGNYVVTPYPVPDTESGSAVTPESFYNNYSAIYESAVYTVIGLTYEMNAVAVDYTDKYGTRPAGTVQIIGTDSLSQYYAAGTALQFYAKANAGYEVDHWSYQRKDGEEVVYSGTESGGTVNTERLNISMEASAATVRVYFKPKKISLKAYNDGGSSVGSVICESDESFSSGAYVSNGAEFTFKAVPAEGYHFRDWSVSETGKNIYTEKGTANEDGTNSVDITVGNESIELKANFERDKYTLELEGNISASYTRKNTAGADQKIDVKNGASIVGDTVITVEPKTGYRPADEAKFVVNGEEVEFSDETRYSYSFPLTKNTTVSLETIQNMYSVSASAENGTVAIKVGESDIEGNTAEDIPGGTTVSFTARAERGYRLAGWKVNGSDSEETGDVLTVSAIGSDLAVEALFTQDAASYTANAAVTPSDRGGMKYTLYDIYGNTVEEDADVPEDGITVYNGEKILFKAVPDAGYMVEQWVNDGKYIVSSSKTYPDGEITVENSDINITAQLKPASLYDLDWIAMGDGEGIVNGTLSVTADGDTLSGNSAEVSGGSTVIFTADPSDGYMVDHWTVTDGRMDVEENTEPYEYADGTVYVDPVLTMDGFSGHKTVRVYFKEVETNTVDLTAAVSDAGKATIKYITPIDPKDDGKQSDGTASAQVRSGGKITFTLAPAADWFLRNSDLKNTVKSLINDDALVDVTEAEGVYTVNISNLNSGITLDMNELFIYRPLYSITLPGDETVGGKVTASPEQAREGDTVTLTVVPDQGYRFTSIAIDKGQLNEEFNESTLTYTFAMPAENVNVTASFTRRSSGNGNTGGGGGGTTVPDKPATDPVPDNGTTDPSALQFTGNVSSLTGDTVEATKNKDGSITVKTGSDKEQPVAIEVKNAGDSTAAYIVKADGTEELVRDAIVIDGKLYINVADGATVKIADSNVAFTDVDDSVWSKPAIEFAASHGLFMGVTADRFGRQTDMTREMLMTVIARLNNADTSGDALAKGMKWAVENGVSDGSAPKSKITREQIVTMLYRNAGKPEVKADSAALNGFKDANSVSSYAKDAMIWAVENGIINGMGDTGMLAPRANATREQVAQMMMNYVAALYK